MFTIKSKTARVDSVSDYKKAYHGTATYVSRMPRL